jgi:hypothetical protein
MRRELERRLIILSMCASRVSHIIFGVTYNSYVLGEDRRIYQRHLYIYIYVCVKYTTFNITDRSNRSQSSFVAINGNRGKRNIEGECIIETKFSLLLVVLQTHYLYNFFSRRAEDPKL